MLIGAMVQESIRAVGGRIRAAAVTGAVLDTVEARSGEWKI